MLRPRSFAALLCITLASCASAEEGSSDAPANQAVTGAPALKVALEAPVAVVDTRYLSIAIDVSQALGGHWWGSTGQVEGALGATQANPFDFAQPRLAALAEALAPAYLRIGGTEADEVYYDLDDTPAQTPPGYTLRLTRERWDAINDFATRTGMRVMFTVNAGRGPRAPDGVWTSNNARALFQYTKSRGYPVSVWELGNEPNAYWLVHKNRQLSAAEYARDYLSMKLAAKAIDPNVRVAGPAAVFWPFFGEIPMTILGPDMLGGFLDQARDNVDVVTWHYYPSESGRCTHIPFVRPVPAAPEALLVPRRLDEGARLADEIVTHTAETSPSAEVWLGETGNAQCGGEPGVSDRFVASLWWADQLGMMARHGQKVSVRQSLAGGDYALLDPETLTPNPDYWVSVLWKRLMGPRVLNASLTSAPDTVRVYAHCTPMGNEARSIVPGLAPGAVTLAFVNLSTDTQAEIPLGGLGEELHRFALTAPDVLGKSVELNGRALELDAEGALPHLVGAKQAGSFVSLAPASIAFVVAPAARAQGCLGMP